jgi:hypothetical protein
VPRPRFSNSFTGDVFAADRGAKPVGPRSRIAAEVQNGLLADVWVDSMRKNLSCDDQPNKCEAHREW